MKERRYTKYGIGNTEGIVERSEQSEKERSTARRGAIYSDIIPAEQLMNILHVQEIEGMLKPSKVSLTIVSINMMKYNIELVDARVDNENKYRYRVKYELNDSRIKSKRYTINREKNKSWDYFSTVFAQESSIRYALVTLIARDKRAKSTRR